MYVVNAYVILFFASAKTDDTGLHTVLVLQRKPFAFELFF